MLFKQIYLDQIATGRITEAYRRWTRPTVRSGGTLNTPVGVLFIETVDIITTAEIREQDAKKAGLASRQALLDEFGPEEDRKLYRIRFHLAGQDPRIALRTTSDLNPEDFEQIQSKLTRLDLAAPRGPWTQACLKLIDQYPERRAGDLAEMAGMEKEDFKINVRKLKNLGLTESLEVGYRISPRGKAYLKRCVKKSAERKDK